MVFVLRGARTERRRSDIQRLRRRVEWFADGAGTTADAGTSKDYGIANRKTVRARESGVMKFDLEKMIRVAAPPTKAHAVRHWIFTLGGPGLILLGLLDSSVIPIPGSMDAMTIVLSAHQRTWWPYYAVMATIGSVVGAYVTYRLARKQGEKALHDRVSPRNVKRVTETFEKYGFGAIAVPALLPPPMPMVPFVIAAGALQYSPKKFLAAMTLGRIVRYCILAYLGSVYGRKIFAVVLAHGEVTLAVVIGLAILGGLIFLAMRFRKKRHAIA